MSETGLHYPGRERLIAVHTRLQGRDKAPADGEAITLLGVLREAAGRGISFRDLEHATGLFFSIIGGVLDRNPDFRSVDADWARQALALADDWIARVPFLPEEEQFAACQVLDVLHAVVLFARPGARPASEALAFLRSHAIPAPETADAVRAALVSDGVYDDRILYVLDVLEGSSTRPSDLMRAQSTRGDDEVQYAMACRQLSGRDLHGLQQLWEFREEVTRAFGSEYYVLKTGFFASDAKKDAAAAEHALKMALIPVAHRAPTGHPFAAWLHELVKGRIEAGTDSVRTAKKIFRRLLEGDVCLWETACQLAFLLNFTKDFKESRQVLEQTALRIPLCQGWLTADTKNTMAKLYLEADGDPALLGHKSPPADFVHRAQSNADRVRAECLPRLRARTASATADFWKARERDLLALLARTFTAADFDAALGAGESNRTLLLDSDEAASICLDEISLPPGVDRDLLVTAASRPLPARLVASEVLHLFANMEEAGYSFAQLTAGFPGFGQSLAVAQGRLDKLLSGGRAGEAAALLDHYERLAGTPDALLAALFVRGYQSLAAGPVGHATVLRGQRLARRLSVGAVEVAAATSELILQRLMDFALRSTWVELIGVLLEIRREEDTQATLTTWFATVMAEPTARTTAEVLAAGELLTGRLGPPYREQVRLGTQQALLDLLDPTPAAARRPLVERLLQLSPGDPATQALLAGWFEGSAGRAPVEMAELGAWLCGQLTGEASAALRACTRDLLVGMLTPAGQADHNRNMVERVLALASGDQVALGGIASWFGSWRGDPSAPVHAQEADMGEWLLGVLPDDRPRPERAKVQLATLAHLKALLGAAQDRDRRIWILSRLHQICPEDADAAAQLQGLRRQRLIFRLKLAGAGAGLLALAGLVLWLSPGHPDGPADRRGDATSPVTAAASPAIAAAATEAMPAASPAGAAPPAPQELGADASIARVQWMRRLRGDRKKVFVRHQDRLPSFEGKPGPAGAARAREWRYGDEVYQFKGNRLIRPRG